MCIFTAGEKKLDILVNNAGILLLPNRTETVDGHETVFATNHLGTVYCIVSPDDQ